jgi:hypothetical protein
MIVGRFDARLRRSGHVDSTRVTATPGTAS